MNLWIEIARDSLVQTIARRRLPDPQRRRAAQLTDKPNLVARRARACMRHGARSVVVAKQGEYGAALFTRESFFALPAYPLRRCVDPTGAGDTFAGGFVGYVAAHAGRGADDDLLRRAMAYGTVLASFNVEEFGTERVQRLTPRRDRRARGRSSSASRPSRTPPIPLRA